MSYSKDYIIMFSQVVKNAGIFLDNDYDSLVMALLCKYVEYGKN